MEDKEKAKGRPVKPVDMPPGGLEIMNVEVLAAYLGLSRRTVYNMAHSGEIPGTKIAGAWRFPKAAIDTWLMDKAQDNLGRGEQNEQALDQRIAEIIAEDDEDS